MNHVEHAQSTTEGARSRFNRTESLHIIPESEIRALVEYLNLVLLNDSHVSAILKENLPIIPEKLFSMCKDGLLLCTLFNAIMPKRFRIPPHQIHATKDFSRFSSMENHNLLIDHCANAGCKLVNGGESDLGAGIPHIVLGIIWRIVELGFSMRMTKIVETLIAEPLKSRLREIAQPREQLLCWINYCIEKRHPHAKIIKNFHSDLKDCVAFSYVLIEVEPAAERDVTEFLKDKSASATDFLCIAERYNRRLFVIDRDIACGYQRLNFAYLGWLFTTQLKSESQLSTEFTLLHQLSPRLSLSSGPIVSIGSPRGNTGSPRAAALLAAPSELSPKSAQSADPSPVSSGDLRASTSSLSSEELAAPTSDLPTPSLTPSSSSSSSSHPSSSSAHPPLIPSSSTPHTSSSSSSSSSSSPSSSSTSPVTPQKSTSTNPPSSASPSHPTLSASPTSTHQKTPAQTPTTATTTSSSPTSPRNQAPSRSQPGAEVSEEDDSYDSPGEDDSSSSENDSPLSASLPPAKFEEHLPSVDLTGLAPTTSPDSKKTPRRSSSAIKDNNNKKRSSRRTHASAIAGKTAHGSPQAQSPGGAKLSAGTPEVTRSHSKGKIHRTPSRRHRTQHGDHPASAQDGAQDEVLRLRQENQTLKNEIEELRRQVQELTVLLSKAHKILETSPTLSQVRSNSHAADSESDHSESSNPPPSARGTGPRTPIPLLGPMPVAPPVLAISSDNFFGPIKITNTQQLRKGWILTNIKGRWRRNFLVLDFNVIHIFKQDKQSDKNIGASFPLIHSHLNIVGNNEFSLQTTLSGIVTVLSCRAQTKKEFREWIHALRTQIAETFAE